MTLEERKSRALEYAKVALEISVSEIYRTPELIKQQQELALLEIKEVKDLEERANRDDS